MTVGERAIAVVRRWGPLATVAGVVGVAGSFAVAGFTVHFVAAPVNAWVVEHTPGIVVTVAILSLGSLGEVLAFAVALVLSALALAAATLVGASVGDHAGDTAGAVLGTYFAGWTVTALLVRAPFVALGAAVPMALVVGIGTRLTVRPLEHGGRRRVRRRLSGGCDRAVCRRCPPVDAHSGANRLACLLARPNVRTATRDEGDRAASDPAYRIDSRSAEFCGDERSWP